ncbi:unnamed protein product [Schistosoma curassoni]|uniref:Uncharacterized protein n=1 Tax=Schistosoma curassoni TaxID=6186 RepID=A0A183KQZ1_9TREM|nr:unnamed protein product [Schistosoma curassoni]
MLVFVKLQPTYLNEKNYKTNVMVCSIPGSPVLSFYTSISKLFAPLLLKGDDKSMLQDPKIQIALTNLAAGLSSIVSEGDGSENMTSIFTLTDEVNYWRNKSRCCSNNNVDEMKQCEVFASLLESPAKECNRIESLSQSALDSNIDSLGLSTNCANSTQKQPSFGVFLTDLIDILDSLLIDTLDELWRCTDPRVKQPYPEHRMSRLIESLSYWTIRMIQGFLGSVQTLSEKAKITISSLWTLPFDEVSRLKPNKPHFISIRNLLTTKI